MNEIVEDVRPERKTKYLTLLMQHHTETEEFNLGWLDFRFLSISEEHSARLIIHMHTLTLILIL